MSDPSVPEVVAPDLVAAEPVADADPSTEDDGGEIESPAKIIRIGGMVKQLLDEVRGMQLDEPSREQLREIYENSLTELRGALSPDLATELDRLALDFDEGEVPTEAQLRIAKAQLVGWLEGLFHGIQATLVAQQMAARSQLQTMRGQLPAGPGGPGPGGGDGPPPTGLGYI
jgi:hypothetical protein